MGKQQVREIVLADLRDQWQATGTDDQLLARGVNSFDLGAAHFIEAWAGRFFGWPERTFDLGPLHAARTFDDLVDVIAARWDGALHDHELR